MGRGPGPLARLEYAFNELAEQRRAEGALAGWRREYGSQVAGRLFVRGAGEATAVHPSDVIQGDHYDCFLVAALAAVVQAHPDPDRFLRDMIKPREDGSFDVTLHLEKAGAGYQPVTVNVLPESLDKPARSDEPGELWQAIVEKAYAQTCPREREDDSYGFGGGSPGEAMARLTGIASERRSPAGTTIAELQGLLAGGHAVTVSTLPKPLADSPLEPVNLHPAFGAGGLEPHPGLPAYQGDGVSKPGPAHPYNDGLRPNHAYYVKSVDAAAGTVTLHNVWDQGRQDIHVPYELLQGAANGIYTNAVAPGPGHR